jgi:spore germination protein (amino acid permease)
MTKQAQHIGPFQLYCVLMQAQFGSAVISIASDINDKSGTSAWISCLIGGVINSLFVYLIWVLAIKAPKSNVFRMLMQRLGGLIGRCLLAVLACFYAIIAYVILTNWIYTTDLWAYERTPNGVLLFIFIAVCIYLIVQPIIVYARFAVLATFFAPVFVIFAAYTLKDWNTYNLLPLIDAGPLKLLDGSIVVVWALAGIEIMLVLPRYVHHIGANKVLRIAMYSNGTTVLFYTFCVLSSTVVLGTDMISYIREPLLYQMKAISFNIIERIDLIIISIWILFVVTSFCSYFILFVSSIAAMLNKTEKTPIWLVIVCGGVFFIAGMWRTSADQLDRLHHYINYWVASMSFGLIAGILLILKMLGTKGTERS